METSDSHPAADVRYLLLTGDHWPNHWLLPYVFISEWLVSEKETEIMKRSRDSEVQGTGVQGDHSTKTLLQHRSELAQSPPHTSYCQDLGAPRRLGGDLLQSPPFALKAM